MFDFEKFDIYKKAKYFNSDIRRLSNADRRNFYVISRSSIFECIAILDVLKDETILDEIQYLT